MTKSKNEQKGKSTKTTDKHINTEKSKTKSHKTSAEKDLKKDQLIDDLKNQVEKEKDRYLRLSAEFDNFRKRTLKEKADLMKFAGEDIILGLLPVIDDFDRAIQHMDSVEDADHAKDGLKLIFTKFNDFLNKNNLKEIDALHKNFDTDLHEAITKIPAPKKKLQGKVVDVIEKGYMLNGKVIRFAKVVIGE